MKFWLRWSLRDLQQRWLQVLAIAVIIALGTGVYSGLGGQGQWRESSYDASYESLHMYDLHLELTEGSYLPASELESVLAGIDGVQAVEPRLIVPTLVDATQNEDETILVRGRMVGIQPELAVNQLHLNAGRGLTESDATKNVAVLDYLFARYYDLKPGDSLRVAGDVALEFVGMGQSPEYFQIAPEEGLFFMAESSYAVLYVPLPALQSIVGRDGLVNNAVVLVSQDRDSVEQSVEAVMAEKFPQTGFTLTTKEENNVYQMLYEDAKSDQQIWNMIAFLFLLGAGMAAFNLAGRIVEAQRREIGIGMALGLPGYKIAFRPMLMGLQIALLGTLLGLGLGYALSVGFGSYVESFMPLPTWTDPFSLTPFVRATVLGILIPCMAALYPVWRAVRVRPVDAIKTGHLVAKGGGLAPLVQNMPLPGKSFTRMPFHNLLRAPWRTVLTLLGIAIAILLLVLMTGFLDSFVATIDRAETAYLETSPRRMTVVLDTFYPVEAVQPIADLTDEQGQPLFTETNVGIMAAGTFLDGEEEIFTSLELLEMTDPIWIPTLVDGDLPDGEGIVISEKTADDLEVSVGDMVLLRHPAREGLMSFRMVDTELKVIGIHNNPLRTPSYMSLEQADLVGIAGLTNILTVQPAAGKDKDDITRALFAQPGVASVERVADLPEAFEEVLALFVNFMRIVQGVVLLLAFLIAFNSTSINVDERRREIATMFAFGLRIRTVTRMQIQENIITGLMGTLVGVVAGYGLLYYLMRYRFAEMMPEVQFVVVLAPMTLVTAGVLGVLAVSLTPILSIRKMVNLNIPSTLRVME